MKRLLTIFDLPATWRRFEFVGGKSNKYWEVSVQDNAVVVHYGRMNTAGQWHRNDFATESDALDHEGKLMQEKMAKGYIETAWP